MKRIFSITVWLMEGHPWIFTWELHQHLIPHQRDGLNFSKAMMQMDMEQQAPSICFISVGNERNCHQINSSFQVTSINHQHTGRKRRIPELNNLKSGLEWVSPNLPSFLPLFQSFFAVPPPSRAQEDVSWSWREFAGPNPSASSKAQFHPHMFTQDLIPGICRQIFKVLTLSHKKPLKKKKSCSQPIVLRISKIQQCFMVDHMETFMCSSL